jgi:predicted ester cyclase
MADSPVDVVRSALVALNAGDIDGYLAGLAPTCERHVAGIDHAFSKDEIADSLRQLVAAFERFRIEEELLFGDRRHACARWCIRGVHVADYLGIAATGREIASRTCEIYEVDTNIVTVWTYGDPGDLFRQIAPVAAPGTPE